MPKAASTRETEVRAVTALSRDGNVSLPEVFVGNDGSSRQLYDNGVVMPVGWTGASTRRRTGSKFTGTLLASTEFPVGDAGANPQRIAPFSRKTWLQGVRDDIRKRSPLYAQDWFDGLRNPAKSAGACLFLYFAVLAPAVAFGGVMQTATCGAHSCVFVSEYYESKGNSNDNLIELFNGCAYDVNIGNYALVICEDGCPQELQVNFLSHFLMVSRLLPGMAKASDPREAEDAEQDLERLLGTSQLHGRCFECPQKLALSACCGLVKYLQLMGCTESHGQWTVEWVDAAHHVRLDAGAHALVEAAHAQRRVDASDRALRVAYQLLIAHFDEIALRNGRASLLVLVP